MVFPLSPDLVLGPAARMLHTHHGVRTLTGSEAAFVPARDFIDGSSIIELRPIAPVHVYQLGFDKLHPTTYLNGERWNDEISTNNEYTNGGRKLSVVESTKIATAAWRQRVSGSGKVLDCNV